MYWDKASSVPSTLKLEENVLRYLRADDRIVDLGCGGGRTLAALQAAGIGRRLVGVDRNPPSLRQAGQRGLPVLRADLVDLPFADGAFDVGILHAVLTTLVPREICRAVLVEARRVVTRVLCVADFLQNWDLPYYQARYESGRIETGEPGSFLVREGDTVLYAAHHFTMMELSGLLAAAGFRVAYAAAPRVRTRSGKDVRGVVLAAVTF